MAILYIAAEANELKPFANHLTGLRSLKWPLDYAQEGILNDRRILLAANGAGPKLAAHALEIAIRAISAADLQSSALEAVVSVGFCGALQPQLREGQVIVATQIIKKGTDDIISACPVESALPFLTGDILSQDRIAAKSDEKLELGRSHQAMAVEMEASGVAVRAKRAGLPFYCIKVVSDRADESFGIDLNELRSKDGRISRGKIVSKAVARPTVIPELFRLRRRAELAASVLGIFLSVVDLAYSRSGSVSQKTEVEIVPLRMQAAVYLGDSKVAVQIVATPAIGPGEVLIRVESCGICHTDLKKIEYNLLTGPRIYGHETAGVISAVGEGVTKYAPGDRVIVFHHIPCGECFYCQRRLHAQCPVYKKVGVTAGFEPAGGGFSQYVRVMDWIVERGIEKIPDGVSFDQACWVEPVNTCLKGVEILGLHANDTVAILGQGPIGLIFTMLVKRAGAKILASDTLPFRRELSQRFGAAAFDPGDDKFEDTVKTASAGRGADTVIVATNARGLVDQALRISRPGAKVLLFAQTSVTERIEISGADICVGERMLLGSYSADVNLQAESARLVFGGELPLEQLISDRVALSDITAGIAVAQRPSGQSLKVVVHPQETN